MFCVCFFVNFYFDHSLNFLFPNFHSNLSGTDEDEVLSSNPSSIKSSPTCSKSMEHIPNKRKLCTTLSLGCGKVKNGQNQLTGHVSSKRNFFTSRKTSKEISKTNDKHTNQNGLRTSTHSTMKSLRILNNLNDLKSKVFSLSSKGDSDLRK